MKTQDFIIATFVSAFFIIIFTACPNGYGYKYDTGKFPNEIVNFEEINTQFDDYNLTAPFIRDVFPLCFSSNRNSNGGQFDIVYKLIAIDFDKETAELKVYNETSQTLSITEKYEHIFKLVRSVNTLENQFGPYIRSMGIDRNLRTAYENIYPYNDSLYMQSLFLLASEKNGNLDIEYIHNIEGENMNNPLPLNFLNTDSNEAYPCFNEDFSELIFCSDINGNYDIFSVPFDNSVKFQIALSDTIKKEKSIINSISSSGDDKCPFIEKNIMVFASNRDGGFGGYDLYYSKFENGKWQNPVNMGERINTQFDEFRPVLRNVDEFENDFLLFSSNRTGGKGGFDLYYTGIDLEE